MKTTNYKSSFDMHFGASQNIQEKAKLLKNNMTNAEKILWKRIRNRKLKSFKFRRQHPIDIFIVDFYCHEVRLAIEVDGEIHNLKEKKEYDENRTAHLNSLGIRVIRFSNSEVEDDINSVLDKISNVLTSP